MMSLSCKYRSVQLRSFTDQRLSKSPSVSFAKKHGLKFGKLIKLQVETICNFHLLLIILKIVLRILELFLKFPNSFPNTHKTVIKW